MGRPCTQWGGGGGGLEGAVLGIVGGGVTLFSTKTWHFSYVYTPLWLP